MTRMERFKVADYHEIEKANGVCLEAWQLCGGVDAYLEGMERLRTYWTVRDEKSGKILFIAGFQSYIMGVCEVSFYPSKEFCKRPLAGYRALKSGLGMLRPAFRRIQLTCKKAILFQRFAEQLGFVTEGVLKKFGPDGSDHLIMAIVR